MHFDSKGFAFVPPDLTHFMDHLAVICKILGYPLVFLQETEAETAKKYYPDIDIALAPYEEMNPENLISEWDVLVSSDLWKKPKLIEYFKILEQRYQKRFRRVYCPHGFSDKMFYWKEFAGEDICLIYGSHMLDIFQKLDILSTLNGYVITGNYRYSYYQMHQKWMDELVEKEVFSLFQEDRPIMLYAPTWFDARDSSSFFHAADLLFTELPKEYNVVVKLHPLLEQRHPEAFYPILGKFEKNPHIVFVKDLPLVFPLLARADLFLGDKSSVGYDFLAFDKPMFFLESTEKEHAYLHSCGTPIFEDQYANILEVIRSTLPLDHPKYHQKRKDVFDYTFGPPKSFEQIKAEIQQAILA